MTDTYLAEQAVITGRLRDEWTDPLDPSEPRTPIAWPNAKYPPSDYEDNPDKYDGKAYIELRVVRAEAFNAASTAKDKLVRHPGLVRINVRVPLASGDGAALELADAAAAIWRNRTVSGLTFRAPTVRDIGPEGAWYRVQVDCPFWRDSILTHA